MPNKIDFNRIDEEEKFLEEQYQQLSQNQRSGRRAPSNQASGRIGMNYPQSNSNQQMSMRVTVGERSSNLSNENVLSQRMQQSEDKPNSV